MTQWIFFLLSILVVQKIAAQGVAEVEFCESALARFAHGVGGFCLNGGTCRDGLADNTRHPCDCPSGLVGPHCEFEEGVVPDCSRYTCYNGGECVAGLKHWNEQVKTTQDMLFCLCPLGFYGEMCEFEEKPCGNDHCRNGGQCVSVLADDGYTYERCDCTTAGDGTHSFAGDYCEHGATSTCSHDHNGHSFCTNGGLCLPDTFFGCECPDGFGGPVCEFEDMGLEMPECHTECDHDGVCRQGAKDLGYLEKFGIHRHRHLSRKYNDNFEHCVCPAGYVGLHCEYQLDVCPGDEQACLNGSECTPISDRLGFRWTCDCSHAATNNVMYAGDLCEHESTTFCTEDGTAPELGTGHEAFCVNDGVCKSLVGHSDRHPGCFCPEGWTGDRCEHEVSQLEPSSKGSGFTLLHAGVIVLAAALIIAGCLCIRKRRQRGARDYYSPAYINNYTDDDVAPAPTLEQVRSIPWEYSDSRHSDDNDSLDDSFVASAAPSSSVSLMKEPLDDEDEYMSPDTTFL